jgi:hypothetical protein
MPDQTASVDGAGTDLSLGLRRLNRTLVGPAHRGDPSSQPYSSSPFWADALAGLNFEPEGADRIAPALAPSGSVFLVNRAITTRVGLANARVHRACRPRCRVSQAAHRQGRRGLARRPLVRKVRAGWAKTAGPSARSMGNLEPPHCPNAPGLVRVFRAFFRPAQRAAGSV